MSCGILTPGKYELNNKNNSTYVIRGKPTY